MSKELSLKAQIRRFVDSLAPDGEWWHSNGRVVFERQMLYLIEAYHVPIDDAKGILEALYSAVKSEYGD